MGNVSNLITKFLNLAIVLRSGWDVKLPLSPSVREELTFWKDNIRLMNGRPIGQRFSTNRTIVYCVASDLVVGWGGGEGGVLKGHDGLIYHHPWSPQEAGRSSTWRELQAVHICLSSFSRSLAGCTVLQWFTDNRNIASIICNGNLKRDLHELALSIFRLVRWNTIDLRVNWVPRSLNKHARGCHYQVHCLR